MSPNESRTDRRRKRYLPQGGQQWGLAIATVIAMLSGGAGVGGVVMPKIVDSGVVERIEGIEDAVTQQTVAQHEINSTIQERSVVLARFDVKLEEMGNRLKRVEEKLDRLFEMKRSSLVSE